MTKKTDRPTYPLSTIDAGMRALQTAHKLGAECTVEVIDRTTGNVVQVTMGKPERYRVSKGEIVIAPKPHVRVKLATEQPTDRPNDLCFDLPV